MTPHLRLGRVLGIEIGANASVAAIAALLAWSLASTVLPALVPGHTGTEYWAAAAAVTVAFFASLLAHELGHALVARNRGIGVERITLWLLGGVSQLSGDVRRPEDELPMAVAGPATSLAIGIVALATANLAALLGLPALVVATLGWLATVNVVLAVFNLLPAFPLDGGRVLRALLWRRGHDRLRATATAARAGTLFAYALFGLGVWCLLVDATLDAVWFWILGMFLLNASRGELVATAEQDLLAGMRVAAVMSADPVTVPGGLSVADLVDRYVLGARHSAYPVVGAGGEPLGMVSLTELRAILPAARPTTPVRQISRPLADLVTTTADEAVTELLGRLTEARATRALVLDGPRLVGLVTLADVARALDARAAARGVPIG